MKKYVKPDLYYENFELSHSVASCDYKLGSGDTNTCRIEKDNYEDDYADVTGGFANTATCTVDVQVYCYTNGGSDLPSVFQS